MDSNSGSSNSSLRPSFAAQDAKRFITSPPPSLPPHTVHDPARNRDETIEELRNLVHDLFDAAPVGYFYLDRIGRINSVNRAGAGLLGTNRDALQNRNLDSFLAADSRSVFHDALRSALSTGKEEACEIELQSQGSAPRYVTLDISPCESGEKCRAVASDITGRRLAEEALRVARGEAERCRAEMEALMNAVPAAVLIAHDTDCRRISGSRFARETAGMSASANFSKSAPDCEQPTDFILMKNGLEIPPYELPVQMAARGREIRDFEYDRVFEDGNVRTMFGNAVPLLDSSGKPRGAIGAFMDITELKLAQESQRRVTEEWERTFDCVPALISIIDNRHRIMRVNESMARNLGLKPEECVGLSCHEVIHGTAFPPNYCPHARTMADGEEHTVELHMAHLGGDFQVATTPLLDKNGERVGSVHIAHDITERKHMEDALRASEQRVRLKLESILAPEGDIGNLSLADIIDTEAVQGLMDCFHKLTHISMALADSEGNMLVAAGWQEICRKFHRTHPKTLKHCRESDALLASGIPEGTFRRNRCKNHLWDIATPVMMGGKQLGSLFMGQFFFDDEQPDLELFRAQAKRYGFDEAQYLAALAAVPRLSKVSIAAAMDYFIGFVALISKLSYSNVKLARSLAERDALMDSLRKSQQQNEFLADIIRHAAQPFGQSYPDGRMGLVNNAFEQLTGCTADELAASDVIRIHTPPEWWQIERDKLNELLRTGKPIRYEKELITKSGDRVPVELLVHMVTDLEGEPQYYYSFITDITERKRAEEAIAGRNALLTGINNIFEKVLHCRTEEELAEACLKVAQEITGSRFGFIGEIGPDGMFHDMGISETGWDACAMFDRNGQRRPPGTFHIRGIYGSVLRTGTPFFTNNPAIHADSIGLPEGHPPLSSFLGAPLKDGEKTIGMVAVGNRDGGYSWDVLETLETLAPAIVEAFQRKRAEDTLKRLNEELENLVAKRTKELEFKNLILSTQNETYVDGILVVDDKLRIISYNRRFLELWGIPPELAEARADGPVLDVVASRVLDRERFLARVDELYANREEKSWEEIFLKDGRVFDRYSAPMLRDDGKYFGKVWYFRDITERREAERALHEETAERLQAIEALREKERMLIQQSRLAAMGEMIGNIAHQWRQPLNNLGLVIQQLPFYQEVGELSGEFLEKSVSQAMDLILHMSKTIDDFRNYFRPDKEKIEFRVRDTIDSTLSLIMDSFRNRHIAVEVISRNDPVIYGYRNEFSQVLLNILNNARDILTERAINDPKVLITIATKGGKAIVAIADNAGGIPDAIRGKIFDPYFTTKDPQSGTGVGLFMSKTIIEKNMGGKLSGRNIAGGAEFRIEV